MNNAIQKEGEMQELKQKRSFAAPPSLETSEGTNISMKDPDTMLSMIVLLLSCLALAVLAHVFV
jgi:hypothetical protein